MCGFHVEHNDLYEQHYRLYTGFNQNKKGHDLWEEKEKLSIFEYGKIAPVELGLDLCPISLWPKLRRQDLKMLLF